MRNNSRMGRWLPDVEAFDGPLADSLIRAIAELHAGTIEATTFLARSAEIFAAAHLSRILATRIEACVTGGADDVLLRRSGPGFDHTLQLIHVAPGEVHPPHVHHNVISTQLVLHGTLRVREFERMRRLADGRLALAPLVNGWYGPGDAMQSADFFRNGHWFAAGDAPAVMLNFNVRGHERRTFEPTGTTLGRRIVDAAGPATSDGAIAAAELSVEAGLARFSDRPLDSLPLAIAAPRDRAFVTIPL
jgi:hypothetical protein